jgi:hypothetical protein
MVEFHSLEAVERGEGTNETAESSCRI